MGRPSTYSAEIAAKICKRLRDGESLRTICLDDDMPDRSTIWDWRQVNEDFATQYTRAKIEGCEALADDIRYIADTPQEGTRTKEGGINGDITETGDMIEHRRLQVDTRKWYLSKIAPKIYGDKLDLEVKGEVTLVDRIIAGRKRVRG